MTVLKPNINFSIGRHGILILFFLFAALFFFLPVETGDIWWHLKSGEYIAQNHRVPHADPFHFAGEHSRWIFTQWLGSLVYYLVYEFGGLAGLQWFRMLLFLTIICIFLRYGFKRMPFTLLLVLTLLLTFGLKTRALLRPFVFNFIFIELFFINLIQFQRSQKYIHLISIALLGLLWVNIHLGSFMYGVSLIMLFLISVIIKCIEAKRLKRESAETVVKYKRILQWFTVIWLIYLLLFFLTPYGLDGFLHPFRSLLIKDYIHFDKLSVTISELIPPLKIFSLAYLWLYILFVWSLVCVCYDRKNRFLHLALLGLSFFMFIYAVRGTAFFALISGFIIINTYQELNFKEKWQRFRWSKIADSLLLGLLFVFLSCHIINMFRLKAIYHDRVFHYLSIRESHDNPKKAIGFLKEFNIAGRVFNDDRYGGYILWHSYPELRPYLDSRQLNFKAHHAYHVIRRDPAKYWPMIDEHVQFKIVFLDSSKWINRSLIRYFLNEPDWLLVFAEGSCAVFVKRGVFDLPDRLLRLEQKLRAYDPLLDNYAEKIALLKEPKNNLKNFFNDLFKTNYYHLDDIATGMSYFDMGFKAAGMDLVWRAFEFYDDSYARTILKLMEENL